MAGDVVAPSLEARLLVLSARPQGLPREQRTEETMSSQTVPDLVIGLLVLALLVFRQLQSRPVRGNQRLLLILLVASLVETSYGLERVHTGPATVAALAGSLVIAAVFGALRACTVRIWMQD